MNTPRNQPAPITRERVDSSDDFRAQVRFKTTKDKLTYAILHGHMSVVSPVIAAANRDRWRAVILAQIIEASKTAAQEEWFRVGLNEFVEKHVAPEYMAQALEILSEVGVEQ